MARTAPSGLNASEFTAWKTLKVESLVSLPVVVFQRSVVPPPLPVARIVPSGLNAIELISPVSPLKLVICGLAAAARMA